MAINKKELFKTVPIKGKQKGNVEVCNYDKKIVIQPNDKNAQSKVEACFDKRPKESVISVGVDTLQAPNNEWMVMKDTQYYKVPDSQKGTVTAQQGVGLGRISKVRANLVFVRYQGTLRKMLKLDRKAPYNYIDADNAIPYYKYLLQNKNSYMSDPKSMELIAWAEGIDKKVKEGKMSFDGESGFDGNTNLDLSFDGNTALDLSFDGEESGVDGSKKFKVVKPQAKIFAQDKSTGVIHFTKRKLGRGSKVSGTVLPKGEFKFRKKDKKTKAISLITKTAGFVKIGENDKANMLVHVSSLRPIVKKSSFDGNTTLDLSFDGNTNIDLSIQGGRVARPRRRKLTPEQIAKRKAKRAAITARRAKRLALKRGKRIGLKRMSKFEGNTNLDLGFDGNTNLDLSFDGGYHRPKIETVPNNLDLGVDGRYMNRGRHLGNRRFSSFNGGALNEDFHGGGDMLYFDGSEEMSNAFGDWFKKQKEKREIKKLEKKEKKALSREQASVLSDPRKVVYTEEEMKDVYKSSGSSKPFSEWTKGEGAKNMLNSIAQFGAAWLQVKSKQAAGEAGEGESERVVEESTKTGAGVDDKGDKKILGMHPITFGIVATVVGLAAIGTIVYLSKKGSAPATTPAIGA